MPSNVHVIVDDGCAHVAIAVNADIVADHAVLHAATREDGAAGNDGVKGDAHAFLVGKNELDRRILLLPATEGPDLVVKIEDRRNTHEVHVGFVVGVDSPDIAPVERFLAVFVDKVIREDAMLRNDARQDVLAEIVSGLGIFGIGKQDGYEELGIENVYAHGRVAVRRFMRRSFRLGRFFLKAHDAPVLVGFDNAELFGGFGSGDFNGGHGNIGAGFDVLFEHFRVIHLVNMVAGEDEDELGALAANRVDVLVHGVGRALVPLLGHAHLRRENLDVFAKAHERRPSSPDVSCEAEGFVLRENKDAPQPGIDAVR